MAAPANKMKTALTKDDRIIGCWLGFGDAYAAELMGTCGFDWLVVDGEHAPNDIRSIMSQLQALETSSSHPVVRLPCDETWMIKQALDVGAQTLLIPMVESAEQAERIVAASRYAPDGMRGMGAALARATRFSQIDDYVTTANQEIAIIVQVETERGMEALSEIAAVDGVDGVFIGPADLSADMGFPGNPDAPEVVIAMERAVHLINAQDKPAGTLATSADTTQRYIDMGYHFIAVGIDVTLLAQTARSLSQKWKDAV